MGAVQVLYAGSGEPCWNPVYLVTRAGGEVRPLVRRLAELIGGRWIPVPLTSGAHDPVAWVESGGAWLGRARE